MKSDTAKTLSRLTFEAILIIAVITSFGYLTGMLKFKDFLPWTGFSFAFGAYHVVMKTYVKQEKV